MWRYLYWRLTGRCWHCMNRIPPWREWMIVIGHKDCPDCTPEE